VCVCDVAYFVLTRHLSPALLQVVLTGWLQIIPKMPNLSLLRLVRATAAAYLRYRTA
jgi:hypothetical protein